MNERRMQFAIGLVTLIAFFALGAVIIWFGDIQVVLQPRKVYYLTFEYAPGAEPKIPVRRAGIRIGEVQKVEYDEPSSQVILTIIIEGDNQLRQGDEPAIVTEWPLGDSYVSIQTHPDVVGKTDRAVIPPESVLEGRSPMRMADAFKGAEDLIPSANQTLSRVQEFSTRWASVGDRVDHLLTTNEARLNTIIEQTQLSTERLAVTLESINRVLDPESQENLRVTIKNLRSASDELTPVLESSRHTIEQISGTTAKLDEVAVNLQDATKPFAERSADTFRNLEESTESLNLLLTDLQKITGQIRSQDGTIQRLLRDPALFENLDDASLLLVGNLDKLDKILVDLQVFADKVARHPGELGIQGVLTRDSGLKTVQPGTVVPARGLFRR